MAWKARTILLILCLCGLAISWHLYEVHLAVKYGEYAGGGACDISATVRCDIAASSDYSTILGIPIAGWGFLYYAFLFFAVSLQPVLPQRHRERLSPLIAFLVLGSIGYSLFLFLVSELILGALCPFCAGLYIVNILSFLSLPLALEYGGYRDMLYSMGRGLMAGIISWPSLFLVIVLVYGWFAFRDHTTQWIRNYRGDRHSVVIDFAREMGQESAGKVAPVRIAIFSDFECPHCERAHASLRKLEHEFQGQLELVFFHYPLDKTCNYRFVREENLHPHACYAATVAEAARAQGKFEEATHALFSVLSKDKSLRSQQDYNLIAASLGLDMEAFYIFMQNPEADKRVREDIERAGRYGVSITPTLFINGRKIVGFPGEESVRNIIRSELDLKETNQAPQSFLDLPDTPSPLKRLFGDCLG